MEPARKPININAEKIHEAVSTRVVSVSGAKAANPPRQPLPSVEFKPTGYTDYVKPVCDRAVALCALLVFAIPMLVVAALIARSMGRPILFRQKRCGLNGTEFTVLKFRTMGADRREAHIQVFDENRITHKSDEDPRHTRVGKVLRRYSLDELPQLINVLRGDMSIVGPRPELVSVVNGDYPKNLQQRHLVRPGLTGLWQISARGDGPMHENGEWDLEYVEQISLLTDLKIICKTPFAMFGSNRGQ